MVEVGASRYEVRCQAADRPVHQPKALGRNSLPLLISLRKVGNAINAELLERMADRKVSVLQARKQ